MSKLSTKLKEEFFALLPPTIFFFLALHMKDDWKTIFPPENK